MDFTYGFFLQTQPSQLVIVRGSPQSTLALDALVRKLLPGTKISKPSLRRVVNLTNGSSQIVPVKLTDSLMSSLQFQKVKGYEIAWVDGKIEESDSNQDGKLLYSADNESNLKDF